MKCQYCNYEIPNDSVFCPECGKEQNISEVVQAFCPECGALLDEGSAFCPECGTPCAAESAPQNTTFSDVNSGQPGYAVPDDKDFGGSHFGSSYSSSDFGGNPGVSGSTPPSQKKSLADMIKSKEPVGIAVLIGSAILIIALAASAVIFFKKSSFDASIPDDAANIPQDVLEDTSVVSEDASDVSEEVDLSEADFNLLEEDRLFLEGLVKKTEAGDRVLRWDNELTFYGEDFDGTKILLEKARNAYIDTSALPDGMLDSIKSNQVVSIDGQLYFDNETLYITPFEILNEDGKDLIAAFEKGTDSAKEKTVEKEKKPAGSDSDYILPQSTSRLLTDSDVSGLDIRQINYAKNEIYARHGRRFQSAELQNYFNSKSWYRGTIDPNAFTNSMLSDIEQKNAEYLSGIEFGMDSRGYQLDQ